MNKLLSHLLMFTVLLVAGCSDRRTSPATTEKFRARLTAALAITDMTKRNDALTSVAQDAAEVAEGEIVKRAIYEMSDSSLQDKAAYDCAMKLVKRNQAQVATDVAKLMHDTRKMNEVLSQIAKGGK